MIYIIIKLISNIIVNIGFFFFAFRSVRLFSVSHSYQVDSFAAFAWLLMACLAGLLHSGRLLFDKEYIFICNASVCVYIL